MISAKDLSALEDASSLGFHATSKVERCMEGITITDEDVSPDMRDMCRLVGLLCDKSYDAGVRAGRAESESS